MGVLKSLLKLFQNKPRNGQQKRRREVHFRGRTHESIERRRGIARASVNTTLSDPATNFEKMSTAEIVRAIDTRQDIQRLEDVEKNVEERMMQSDSDAEIARLERVLEKFSNAWEQIYDKEIAYTLEPECLRWNSSLELFRIAGRYISVEEYKRIKRKFSDIAHHFSPITLDEEDSECPISNQVIRGCVQLQELRKLGVDEFIKRADEVIEFEPDLVEFLTQTSGGASARCLLEDELSEIPGIGNERARLLFDKSIRSVDDVLAGKLDSVSVPGIGPKTREKINAWINAENRRRKRA